MQVFKLSPLVGEGVNRQVDGRGKCEQTQKNDSNLCTQAYPYRLAWLGTSLRIRGKRTTKEESNQVFINEIEWKLPQKNRIQTASRPRLSGKVSAELTKGVRMSRNEKRVSYGTALNTCLSFLNEVKNLRRGCKI